MPQDIRKTEEQARVLAISLQRQKTAMEQANLQVHYWDAYWKLSEAIWSIERMTGLNAPALRDEEDAMQE